MVETIGVRGSTLARLAMFQTGGDPSTWFPPVGLLELYFTSNTILHTFNSITSAHEISMAGWLTARLAGWLAAWPAGWLAAGWLAGWPADKNGPLPENLRQIGISIALSPGSHTQLKSSFIT